ncbi:ABC-type Fe3+-hydroxamate transport system, periplasmic component [Marinitoga piezophila KA3]|uniref:ABC-type Fe3+-hydroxamate transport system, periplasmic component n=1 Tax=Marinitoga piezophila (strain DSM 14283 / JCM 11233 / KA3) TaxID=443254 RepID=H2J7S6_MARPK|nr:MULTISPECIES: ABC transporter substrate-binding protein [Marinitoga]AEX85417.1 ABC-type Fe3+-hydroxamate transport system, periplasmic component [Marinitoga piezophila KA3]APT75891.1 iron ABC transporter substrate-binding protein [Marinitoga sp. 1137]
MKKVFLATLLLLSFMAFAFQSVTLVDDLGRVVVFDKEVERIVVAAPAISDFIVKLGAKDKVVGVTDFDSYITDVEKIGNMVPLNVEKIVSLNPDVVLLTGGFQEGEVSKLEKFGIKAFVINPTTLNEMFRDLSLVGVILGKEKTAQDYSFKLRQRMLNIAKNTFTWKEKPRVIYLSAYGSVSQMWTCGTGAYLNELIAYAGGINVTAPYTGNNGWFAVGPEFVIKEDPDIILVPSYYPGDKGAYDLIMNAEQFKDIKAVKNKKVFIIDGNKASLPNTGLIDLLGELNKLFSENR